jgi:hypothetical protein
MYICLDVMDIVHSFNVLKYKSWIVLIGVLWHTKKAGKSLTFRKKSNTHKNHNLSFSSTELHIYLERELKSRKWSQDGGNWRGMSKSYWLGVCSSPFLLFLSARLTQSWATSVPKFCHHFKVTEPGYDNSIFLAVPGWYSNNFFRVLELVQTYESRCT